MIGLRDFTREAVGQRKAVLNGFVHPKFEYLAPGVRPQMIGHFNDRIMAGRPRIMALRQPVQMPAHLVDAERNRARERVIGHQKGRDLPRPKYTSVNMMLRPHAPQRMKD